VAAVLPPPTDRLDLDSARKALAAVTGFPQPRYVKYHELAAKLCANLSAVENHLRDQGARQRSPFTQHKRFIEYLSRSGVPVLLIPNTHAKFVVSDSGFYEGSGNLTLYGTSVNVENYMSHRFLSATESKAIVREYLNFFISRFRLYTAGLPAQQSHIQGQIRELRQAAETGLEGIHSNSETSADAAVESCLNIARSVECVRESTWLAPGHATAENLDLLGRMLSRGIYVRFKEALGFDHEESDGRLPRVTQNRVPPLLQQEFPEMHEAILAWATRCEEFVHGLEAAKRDSYESSVQENRRALDKALGLLASEFDLS
jgi:hypothetical protein